MEPDGAGAPVIESSRKFDPIAETRRQWERLGLGHVELMEATTAVLRLQQIILGRINETLRPFDLTFPQYEALLMLDFSKHGVLSLGTMARRLTLHPATVTNTVDQLEAKQLAKRERHETDRRMVLARLTERGRTSAREANAALDARGYGLAEMPVDDANALIEVVRRFRSTIDDYIET